MEKQKPKENQDTPEEEDRRFAIFCHQILRPNKT